MKKVLIVAGIGHAFTRVFPLGAYLPEFDWDVTVLTPPVPRGLLDDLGPPRRFLSQARIVEVPYRGDVFWWWRRLLSVIGIRSTGSLSEELKARMGMTGRESAVDVLLRWYQTLFAYPDVERAWRGPAFRVAARMMEAERYDAVISSSPFPTVHIVASNLKRTYGLTWLADFRDLWTKNHNYPYGVLRKWLEERLELSFLRDADVMTAVSTADAVKQQQLHGKSVVPIFVGFDPETLVAPEVPLTERFTITYTGTIYTGKQNPEVFLRVLSSLVRQGKLNPTDVEVRFYGRRLTWLGRLIAELGLSSMVVQYGLVSRGEAMQRQRESHVLLMFNWEDPREHGVYTLKLFEYLAARRPVLASGGTSPHDVESMLSEAAAGVYAAGPEAIERAIVGFYQDYRTHGHVPYRGRLPVVSKYDYRQVARRFADLLNGHDPRG